MITILATVFVFGLIVFIHELGHFVTAKMCGMRVDEFAIGFGPSLISVRRGETLYSIRIIPLGGYNKIAGMDPEEPQDERSFQQKSVWQRMLVISAGAVMNFLLAVILFFSVFALFGVSQPTNEPIVGRITTNGPAEKAGFLKEDRIINIGGKEVSQWKDINKNFSGHANEVVSVKIIRNGVEKELTVIPAESDGRVIIGIYPLMKETYYTVGESLFKSVSYTGLIMAEMVQGIFNMVTGQSKADVAGPLGVAQMAGQVANIGFSYLLQFTAVLSINLGILNLLPVPALDGGHIVVLMYEAITRRRLPDRILYYIQTVGIVLMVLLFMYATGLDLSRLWAK